MVIFRKEKQSAPAATVRDLFTEPECEHVDLLWRFAALPRDEFDTSHGAMLARSWRYVAARGGECWAALKSEALTCAVAALRVRQAHVLPPFAGAEDVVRLAEVMSFALVAAVVAERFGLQAGRAMSKDWCPLTAACPPWLRWTTDRHRLPTACHCSRARCGHGARPARPRAGDAECDGGLFRARSKRTARNRGGG